LAVLNAWAGTRFAPDEVFENFAITLSDFLSQAPVEVAVEGKEKAEAARARGLGAIFLTSHLGHWELGGRILADWGWPVTAVYKPYSSARMQDFIQKRRAPGLRYLAVGKGAAAGIARRLRHREVVAILGDRPFGEEGALVEICGRKARLPKGPFLFSCYHGAPVIPGFVVREAPGRYRAFVEDPLWPEGKGPDAVDDLLRRMACVLENRLARHGSQWYCLEPFWE
jgi:KDO2-lipid IV(A) lauroyltransferase